ncbi:MAG: hypothetical protein PF961_19845 [Planctomycetota bacterium]|jgi:hypothetical protein|nr:hypothetical protein [Planctomycetota bacterium]
MRYLAVSTVIMVLAACGGGDPGAQDSPFGQPLNAAADSTERRYHADGSLAAAGPVDDGKPNGLWQFWDLNGQLRWQAYLIAGAFDPSQAWTEFNADGSIRATSGDGAPLSAPPL